MIHSQKALELSKYFQNTSLLSQAILNGQTSFSMVWEKYDSSVDELISNFIENDYSVEFLYDEHNQAVGLIVSWDK